MTEEELLASLGQLPDNDVNLPRLTEQMRSGMGVIPFVGAGLSAPPTYKFPLWGVFLREVAKRAGLSTEVDQHLQAFEYEEAAGLLQNKLQGRFQNFIEHYFGDQHLKNVKVQGAIGLIPRITIGPVITTNFDRLLERAFNQAGCPFPVSVWHDKVHTIIRGSSANRLMLLKLHGDWDYPSERVLTLKEYCAHYGSTEQINFELAIPQVLKLLVNRPILFVGCSLRQDRTTRIMSELASGNESFRHYAILPFPNSSEEQARRQQQMEEMNIRPLWYPAGQHSKVEEILAYLAEFVPEPQRLVKQEALPVIGASEVLSTFVGREEEQKELKQRILKYRLVTVKGAPGVGKTRLAREVAGSLTLQMEFKPQLQPYTVTLSQLPDPTLIPQRIAHTIEVKGQPNRDLVQLIAEKLGQGSSLLVLDSCETALPGCAALVRKLLMQCPNLRIVLTSRNSLGELIEYGAEHVYQVPPLELPDPDNLPDLEKLLRIDSVELLLDRIQARSTIFHLTKQNAKLIAQLCRDLDGIPLALELVAAKFRSLSLEEVLQEWNKRLDFKIETALEGQERQVFTLRKAIQISYDLLGREHNGAALQRFFRRLSVFHRGWTAQSAKEVCGEEDDVDDPLDSLQRASLIEGENINGERRSRYLDAIREFAAIALKESGEDDAINERHARWATNMAETQAEKLLGEEQSTALARLTRDAANLREALIWVSAHGKTEMALRLAGALWRAMEIKGFYQAGCQQLDRVLQLPGAQDFPLLRSKVLSGLSLLAYRQGKLKQSKTFSLESLRLEREFGSAAGKANALNDLGNVANKRGQYKRAEILYRATLELERTGQNRRGEAVALFNVGRLSLELGWFDAASKNLQDSLNLFNEAANKREAAFALNGLGLLACLRGDYRPARRFADESLAIRTSLEDQRGEAETKRTKARIAIHLKEFESARALLESSAATVDKIGDERGVAETLEMLALLMHGMKLNAKMVTLYAAAEELRKQRFLPLPPVERSIRKTNLDRSRDLSGGSAFDNCWEDGRFMPFKEALSYGLDCQIQAQAG